MKFEDVAPILEAVGMASARDEAIDGTDLARDLGLSPGAFQMRREQLEAAGLLLFASAEEGAQPPILTEAGRHYLARKGEVDSDSLFFLGGVIDDLHARYALLHAGTVLVDEFSHAVADHRGVDYAREFVPPAFAQIVDERLAVDLLAAAVALLARLTCGRPAGCVAEEIAAVRLLEAADGWLEMESEQGAITDEEARSAAGELRGLFSLFEDDDVLGLFEMREPADAALAEHSVRNAEMGVADQRPEAWFNPFGGIASTGHLSER